MKKLLLFAFILPYSILAQDTFPKITGHAGIVHPLVTLSDGNTSYNFNNSYTVSFPVAVNIWKTNKIGFSFEAYPTIKNENGSHKMANFTFHPGILYRFSPTFTFAGRAAFETSGRYGVTPESPNTAVYHYFITDSYPFIPRCVFGAPASWANDGSVN